ncbi:selenocysteine-specific translation elongation factor [Telmatospirillum sp. J64-1]|uniref:selenocysteine-specific translation elongation factor n=1 Tax=Telmatospirillum sp. J64-1 TaxID=2502183 RepID=UPI00115D807F|nr:selenocysteine-specific translation elongation factor [Telmatospirillum sp. J64-1]
MKTALVGVIGHVDHGKTALVRALTGIETDRLREERERGISIVLGFSHLAVPGGEIDLIDMPGHERFVRTMVSGATGIEAVLLVVAANEGIKPQTVEHLDIAALIGVKRGIVAVTKTDLVPEAEALRVGAETAALAASSGIAASVVLTSAVTGQGIEELAAQLATILRDDKERREDGIFYLPVDRVFSLAGFGTIVTGTLRRGRLSVGDEVEVFPGGRRAQIRALQIHGRPVESAGPGRRIAVNLRNIGTEEIPRGTALASPGLLKPSRWLDVHLSLLKSAPAALENGRVLRLLFGTSSLAARVRLLEGDRLEPGHSCIAQLRLEAETALPAGEVFILRTESRPRTIAGGYVINPTPPRRRRIDVETLSMLQTLSRRPALEVMADWLKARQEGMPLEDLARQAALSPDKLRQSLPRFGLVLLRPDLVVHDESRARMERQILSQLRDHHRRHPTEPGLSKARLQSLLSMESRLLDGMVAHLVGEGLLNHSRGLIRTTDFNPEALLSDTDRALLETIESAFRRGGLKPPDIAEIVGSDRRKAESLRYLLRKSVLIRTHDRVQKRDIIFHRQAVIRARRILEIHLGHRRDGFLVAEAGKLLGISRKFSIPLLEYLDQIKVTRRIGDRRLIGSAYGHGPDAPKAHPVDAC